MIGLLLEKQVTCTGDETDVLVAQAKRMARESGRTVRAEAELLLSRDTQTRLRDLRSRVTEVRELLAAIAADVDELRAGSGDEGGGLAAIEAAMAASCAPFTSPPAGGATTAGLHEDER